VKITVEGESAEAWADLSLTERVVANLVGNAVRYARKSIRIQVDGGERAVNVRVINDGPGIDDAFKQRIFVPFVQLHDGMTGGAGLGLAFCRLVADKHAGKLELASATAGEVCFALELPRPAP
jgi:two-component system sensor histidine kinase RstB